MPHAAFRCNYYKKQLASRCLCDQKTLNTRAQSEVSIPSGRAAISPEYSVSHPNFKKQANEQKLKTQQYSCQLVFPEVSATFGPINTSGH